jgi:hypothetical protein
MKKKNLAGRLARLSLQLHDLEFWTSKLFAAAENYIDADVLSRNPVGRPRPTEEIPTLMMLATNKGNMKKDQ